MTAPIVANGDGAPQANGAAGLEKKFGESRGLKGARAGLGGGERVITRMALEQGSLFRRYLIAQVLFPDADPTLLFSCSRLDGFEPHPPGLCPAAPPRLPGRDEAGSSAASLSRPGRQRSRQWCRRLSRPRRDQWRPRCRPARRIRTPGCARRRELGCERAPPCWLWRAWARCWWRCAEDGRTGEHQGQRWLWRVEGRAARCRPEEREDGA